MAVGVRTSGSGAFLKPAAGYGGGTAGGSPPHSVPAQVYAGGREGGYSQERDWEREWQMFSAALAGQVLPAQLQQQRFSQVFGLLAPMLGNAAYGLPMSGGMYGIGSGESPLVNDESNRILAMNESKTAGDIRRMHEDLASRGFSSFGPGPAMEAQWRALSSALGTEQAEQNRWRRAEANREAGYQSQALQVQDEQSRRAYQSALISALVGLA